MAGADQGLVPMPAEPPYLTLFSALSPAGICQPPSTWLTASPPPPSKASLSPTYRPISTTPETASHLGHRDYPAAEAGLPWACSAGGLQTLRALGRDSELSPTGSSHRDTQGHRKGVGGSCMGRQPLLWQFLRNLHQRGWGGDQHLEGVQGLRSEIRTVTAHYQGGARILSLGGGLGLHGPKQTSLKSSHQNFQRRHASISHPNPMMTSTAWGVGAYQEPPSQSLQLGWKI